MIAADSIRANRRYPEGEPTSSPLSARRLIRPASPVACDVGREDAGGTALILAVRRSCFSSPRQKLPKQGGAARALAPLLSDNSFDLPMRFLTRTGSWMLLPSRHELRVRWP